ncbi:MAG: histidinol dehydrogenase, partial [Flavobacteriales bacterium]|nr:histidinol dehydrogenase [Flavobacteriales bacterium]
MIVIERPNKDEWMNYTFRPGIKKQELDKLVGDVIVDVQLNGDKALERYTEKFDRIKLNRFKVEEEEFNKAVDLVSDDLKNAIALAKENIEKFHKSQIYTESKVETTEGVECWRKSVAIEKVGLYIPGGTAPLFSTVLMLSIP